MPIADTLAWPHWLAATSITFLLWWTIASPLLVLGVAVLAARRPRVRSLLTIAVCAPPLLVLLPLTAMRGGTGAVASGAAAGLEIAAVVLSLIGLAAPGPPRRQEDSAGTAARENATGGTAVDEAGAAEPPLTRTAKLGWAGVFCAVAGGMVGSLAFLTLFS